MAYAQVNGIQLHYELTGQDSGDVILFLHGLGSSGRDWEPQIAHFQANYRVLTVDMRGHGQSDKPRMDYTMALFAQDTVALLKHLHIDKVHLVGISMGGMIAFQMAVDAPDYLQSMTIVNSAPAAIFRTLKEKSAVWLRFLIVRFMGMRKMGETLAPRLFVAPEQEQLRQIFIERWAENDPKAYMAAMRAIVNWTVEDRIHTITIPTLIVASDLDYTPLALKEAYLPKLQSAELQVMENAHHAVSMEHPDAFNQVVEQFITRGNNRA